MIHRLLTPSGSSSFFVFGARGTGKSTFLREQWGKEHFYINLLLDRWERRYTRDPDMLIADIEQWLSSRKKSKENWVAIDEVQKIPKLLDVVQALIETKNVRFALTGSSARKLKKSSANMLAGRAFTYRVFPLTHNELASDFDLDFVLNWGALPSVFSFQESDRLEYLRAYAQTYLREEILQEQLVRNGSAFRNFLEVSAQQNGKVINFSKIAQDVGVDTKTAQTYFQILEDTLVGYVLPAFTRSVRKSVRQAPKFYFFDLGVKRAIENALESPVVPRTSSYGDAFEHFVILEAIRLNSYSRKDYRLFHYQTTAGGELDLVLQKGKEVIAVEIKSSEKTDETEVAKYSRVAEALKPSKIFYVSRDSISTDLHGVKCLHWKTFLKEVFPVSRQSGR